MRPLHWLLDVEIGGAVYRIADTDLEVDSGSAVIPYGSGLAPLDITIGEGPAAVTVTIAGGEWSDLVDRGADLTSGTATLRLWQEGDDLDSAEIVVTGRIYEPEYGTAEDPLTFSVDSTRWDSTETVPPRTAQIDETTWPVSTVSGTALEPDPSALGASYVRVYGWPGRDAARIWGTLSLTSPAVPAYVAEFGSGAHTYASSALIVADGEVGATTLRVTDVSGGYDARGGIVESTLDVTTMLDLRGRRVSVCVIGTEQNVHVVPGNEYWTTWSTSGGGGVIGPDGEPIRALGAVIEDLLQQAGVSYDRGRMAAARARLDQFGIDCYVAGARPEDWVDEQIGSILPILRREGPDGVWWELWRYDATATDAILHLVVDDTDDTDDEGVIVQSESRWTWSDSRAVENDITLRYLPTRDGYAKSVRLRGIESPDAGVDEIGSYLASVSRSRYGDRLAEITADVVAEDSTALLILQWRALWRALPRRACVVSGGPEIVHLRPNDVVTVSWARTRLSRAVALVREVTIGIDGAAVGIELIDIPTARGRPSA